VTSNFTPKNSNTDGFQDDEIYKSPPQVGFSSRFTKFREMVNQYKRINALTRYLIRIIAVIVIAGILVVAYEVFT
jgi:hypothetical protein